VLDGMQLAEVPEDEVEHDTGHDGEDRERNRRQAPSGAMCG
jgi:hypothetical protein